MRRGEAIADALDARVLGDADVLVPAGHARYRPGVGLLDDLDTIRAQLATVPHVANMAIFNVSGHPAISVPAGFDSTMCRSAPRSSRAAVVRISSCLAAELEGAGALARSWSTRRAPRLVGAPGCVG